MKKIVVFMLPETHNGCEQDEGPSASCSIVDTASEGFADPRHSHVSVDVHGGMRIEAMVSDSQAQRVMSTLFVHESGKEADSVIDDLLEKELEVAGPEAGDLFERIVLRLERQLISRVYAACDHVKTKAAARLGINRNTLHKKLRQYKIV